MKRWIKVPTVILPGLIKGKLKMDNNNKNESIRLKICEDYITITDFRNSIDDFYFILTSVAKDIYSNNKIKWKISVESGSNNVVWYPYTQKEVNTAQIINTIKSGIQSLGLNPLRPKHFNNDALEKLQTISRRFWNEKEKKAMAEIIIENEIMPLNNDINQNIKNILSTLFKDYGAIEGRLESINIKNGLKFSVYDNIINRNIKCEFDDNQIEFVKDALAKRVSVNGIIYYDREGLPNKIKALNLIAFKENKNLPSYKDVKGLLKD